MAIRGTNTFSKAIGVLRRVAEADRGLGFSELQSETGLPKATLHRLLAGLQDERLLRLDAAERRYRAGSGLLELARQAWDRLDVRRSGEALLRQLNADTGETVHLAELDGPEIVYIDKLESPRSLRMASAVGMRNPAYCTGVGKALLATLDEAALQDCIARMVFRRFTPRTLASAKALRADLEATRGRGYAVDDEEHELGIRCVAAPVFDHRGRAVASVSVTMPVLRGDHRRLRDAADALLRTTNRLTNECGGAPRPPWPSVPVARVRDPSARR